MYKNSSHNTATVEMADYDHLDEMGRRLQAAVPHLILMVRSKGNLEYECAAPFIREGDLSWDQLFDDGYDPYGSSLGPVYWRIVRRADETLYLSTFPVRRDDVIRIWGPKGLAYCDLKTGIAVARVETVLRDQDDQHSNAAVSAMAPKMEQ